MLIAIASMEASSSPHAARPPPRPRLGSRSQTHGPVLASPPKKRTTGDNGIDSPTKPKPKPKEHHHHLPFFSGSSHDKDPKADSSSKHDQTSRNESSSSKHDSNSKHDQSSSRDHSHKYLPHIPYVSRKTTDAASSKKDLRQQIKNVNPVEGLQTMMSNRSGHQLDDASVKQQQSSGDSQEPTVAPRVVKMPDRLVRPEDVARERERAKLRER